MPRNGRHKDCSDKITRPFIPSHSYCILTTNKYLFKLAPSWWCYLAKTGPLDDFHFPQLLGIRCFRGGELSLSHVEVARQMPAAEGAMYLQKVDRTLASRFCPQWNMVCDSPKVLWSLKSDPPGAAGRAICRCRWGGTTIVKKCLVRDTTTLRKSASKKTTTERRPQRLRAAGKKVTG